MDEDEAAPENAGGSTAAVIRRLMRQYRLGARELAQAANISERSLTRLRAEAASRRKPLPRTLRRLADAFGDLAHLDAEDVYRQLMEASGQGARARQATLGIRGAAELVGLYSAMSPTGRHILLEQARILARELPAHPG